MKPPRTDFPPSYVRTVAVWPQVGMLARWLGCPSIPGGATSNPPAPGWVPRKPQPDDPPPRDVDCEIIAVEPNEYINRDDVMNRVTRLRALDDDLEFDATLEPDMVVPLVCLCNSVRR